MNDELLTVGLMVKTESNTGVPDSVNTANTSPSIRVLTISATLVLSNKIALETFTKGGNDQASNDPSVIHLYDTSSPGQIFSRPLFIVDDMSLVASTMKF